MDVTRKLKRDVAVHRTAVVLQQAIRARLGAGLALDDLDWLRETTRAVLDLGDEMLTGSKPEDPRVDERAVAERERLARSEQAEVERQRSRARVLALSLGHDLGFWHHDPNSAADEVATCATCTRTAQLLVLSAVVDAAGRQSSPRRVDVVGSALMEPCSAVGASTEEVH